MLGSLKRLFAGPGPGLDLTLVSDWAKRSGHVFRRARDDEGFAVEGTLQGKPWRMEWGPPQRDYIEGHELRLRMELAMRADMQMLVLSRSLMDVLERRTYEQFTEGTQTQIGDTTPEEMRWLVMFPKLDLSSMPKLALHFGAVASVPAAGMAWITGPLAHMIDRARTGLLSGSPPFVLMTLRSRAYLRVQLAAPDPAYIASALEIFETGVAQALSTASTHADSGGDWSTTATSAWQSLRPPEDPGRRQT